MAFPIIICFYFFFLSPFHSSALNPPLCNLHDSFMLLEFKNSFSLNHSASTRCDEFYDDFSFTPQIKNSSYPKTALWGNDSNCCSWDGITCDSISGHVIGLDLICSWLQGQLHPNNSLFQLSHLQTLNLAYNDFSGSLISSQFGDLSALMHLNLSYSGFVGEIPPKIAELSKLVSLDLSWNEFFLDEWSSLRLEPSTWEKLILNMTSLRELVLDDVNMSSIAPRSLSLLMNLSSSLVSLRLSRTTLQGNVTSDIFCLESLQQLDLSHNTNLNSQLPKSNWSSAISLLDLSDTAFSGELPDSIGHLKNMNHLNLRFCHFEGRIPLGLSNLTQLTYLNLAFNNFSGEILFFSKLEHLTSLNLEGNKFFGEIQFKISRLSKLVSLNLGFNYDMKGSSLLRLEPSTWEKLILNATNLRVLGLGYVNMSSVTPNSFSLLRNLSSSLISLSLAENSLQGNITDAILYLENLQFLTLVGNIQVQLPKLNWSSPLVELILYDIPFSGEVPDSIGHLKSLEMLYLINCQFEGPIPQSFKNLTQLTSLDLSSNKFSGGVSSLSTLVNLIDLSLSNNSFSGQIPLSLSNFEYLYSLDLSMNNFSGEIPDVFGNLSHLYYLTLNNNNFSGQVPSSLLNTSVTFLDLSSNMLHGSLPNPFFEANYFSVSNNKFSGNISFLFCNVSSLEILNLSHNILSGPIPQCLVGLPNLLVLDLQMNGFSGTLPYNFSKSNVLQTLHFNSNRFKGSLPLSLAHCTQLEIFDVGHNEIKDTFPIWLDALPELQVLVLRENKFYGAISSSKTKHPFTKLRIFDISNNHFNGSLPATYIKQFEGMMKTDFVEGGSQYMGSKNYSRYKESVMITWKGYIIELKRILTIFTTIDLSNNRFDGEIPKAIGELHALIGLNLSHNRISSSIPRSIGKLTSLEWLDLSCNKLKGEIPQTLTNLNFLAILNLSQNQLEGMIPRGEQFNTFERDSYEGNSRLCGIPLLKSCNKDEGESPTPIFDVDEKFGFGWKPVAWGYGCGMVFGIFMGYVMFSIGKPQWLVRTFGGQFKKQAKRMRNRGRAN
ncbi:receptor-like protein Cf-9 homolog [Neltuma alba]|uniref:receptor-like protein Cf-9 homolog n=1 Tax=Neltuma alba TaxID=207710 RepID=UPI0010A2ECD0|nr:receptor-like protein Cf-9 homolog [Prosopis alba]